MNDAISETGGGIAVELRPGVLRPDWSAVSSEAAGGALRARHASRSNLVEKWAVVLHGTEDRIWRSVIKLFVDLGRAPRIEDIAIQSGLDGETVARILRELHKRDLLGLSDSGEVLHAYPFTTCDGAHRRTWRKQAERPLRDRRARCRRDVRTRRSSPVALPGLRCADPDRHGE